MTAIPGETTAEREATAGETPAARITRSLLQSVKHIADDAGAKAVFIYADAVADLDKSLLSELEARWIYVTKTRRRDVDPLPPGHRVVRVPNVPLSRLGQVKIAVLLALYHKLISPQDIVVFLTGTAASGSLDTLAVMRVGDEFEMFLTPSEEAQPAANVQPELVERVINLAAELGSEGREGRPVGALFVIGNPDELKSLTKKLILNPFQGYPPEQRNIFDPRLEETIKELATIDGAFVVSKDGAIESAGTYIKATGQTEFELPRGLGTRHQAAAAVTGLTDAIAVTVSQSTGTVTVFRAGHIVAELEKPRSAVRHPLPEESPRRRGGSG